MTSPIDRPASMSALRGTLRDFYDDYGDALDQWDLDRWQDFFVEDCTYRVIPRENFDAGLPIGLIHCIGKDMIRDRVTALRETTMYEPRNLRHFISGVHIVAAGAEISARANFALFECVSDDDPVVNMFGQYVDTLMWTDTGPKIRSRECVVDNYRVRTSLIMPV